MKRNYIHPSLEIMPMGTMVALCASGDGGGTNETIGGGGNGGNPWTTGMMPPRRTPAF